MATTEEKAIAVKQAGALARIERGESLMLTTPVQIQGAIEEFKGAGYNVVCPVASIGHVPSMHAVTFRAVTISQKDCYQDRRFCGQQEWALKGDALNKLAAASGANIVSRVRLDDRSDPHLCEVEITVAMRGFDGQVSEITKAKTMDLRDGADEALESEKDAKGNRTNSGRMQAMTPSALSDKRRHIQSHAETKAYLRCLRAKLVIQQKYTEKELGKPFVVPVLIPALDPSDPDQKKALIEQASMSVRQLYGRQKDSDAAARAKGLLHVMSHVREGPVTVTEESFVQPPAADPSPEPDASESDFELVEALPPPVAVCACACGCQVELKPEAVATTVEVLGTPRCRACFPGAALDEAKHRDMEDFKLPKKPGYGIQDWRRGRAAKAQVKK